MKLVELRYDKEKYQEKIKENLTSEIETNILGSLIIGKILNIIEYNKNLCQCYPL